MWWPPIPPHVGCGSAVVHRQALHLEQRENTPGVLAPTVFWTRLSSVCVYSGSTFVYVCACVIVRHYVVLFAPDILRLFGPTS